ncbi:MAG: alpha-amylase family glycosyl hydrolase [Clostridia bacterium]|nr:alpha-amylase family glycosyl hydrolase [Clostridia bacterium]
MLKRKISALLLTLSLTLSIPGIAFASGTDIAYNGNDTTGNDIMLQGFHWNSANGTWYTNINNMATTIGSYFNVVWMPPPSQSYSTQGYLPEAWYNLNNRYGTQAQLKTAIATLKSKNVKVLADIVVNHRNGMTACPHGRYINFSNPTMTPGTNLIDGDWDTVYSGSQKTCSICANNNNGEGTWSYGGRTYYNDDYNAAPDLTHWAADTQNQIKSWQTWLKNATNAGFDGWRYDFIRGFAPQFLNTYNTASSPYLSVGEFWKFENEGLPSSARQALADYVNASGNKTMVFDFDLKRSLNNAFSSTTFNGGALGSVGTNTVNGLVGWWSQAAVTFVDNHDTGWSPGVAQNHWPLPNPCNGDLISTKAAYALVLTHPGVPNVYWADWRDRGTDMTAVIETLIKIRRSNNVKRWSDVRVVKAENGLYTAYVGTANAEQLAIKIGNAGWANYEGWTPSSALGLTKTFTRYYSGGHAFCVYYKNTAY